MNTQEKKQISVALERIIDVVCLVLSYGILFLLPKKVDFLFYLLFGVSAFLFCVGFFRLGFTFDAPTDRRRTVLTGLLFTFIGVLVNLGGLCYLYLDQGSGRSITVATLLLIEALVFYAMAGSKAEAPGARWAVSILFRAAAVLLLAAGIFFVVSAAFTEPSVILGTIVLIEAICLWMMGRGNNPFQTMTSEQQVVPGMRTPIRQLHETFADVETQLGRPWIGKIRSIKSDALIYGPLEDGFFVYCYYLFGQFYVAASDTPLFPAPECAERHILTEIPDPNGVLISKNLLAEAYADMFARYLENGSAAWDARQLEHKKSAKKRRKRRH
jgi:hypothetical protein